MRLVFIVTVYQQNKDQKEYLYHCVAKIRQHHRLATIVLLDDDHTTETLPDTVYPCIKEKTKHPRCGEVNAYVWACQHRTEYDIFVYIHDTTILIQPLPLELPNHFRPLWHSSKCMNNNVHGSVVNTFMDNFRILGNDCKDILKELRANRGGVCFGSMAIFDQHFLTFLSESTNFLELAYMLNTRFLRSFFERVIYIVYCKFSDPESFNKSSLCGDIFKHGNQFRNTEWNNPKLANNPYILKIWQGR